MPAKAPKPILKLRKSPTGTKHTINRKSVKPLIGEGYYLELNKGTPKAKEWTPKQLEKLKKIGKENAKVRQSQKGVLDEYYKKKANTFNREPVYKPRGLFVNVPVSEIRLDPKIGMMVFTGDYQGKPRQYRISRKELLTNDYYKEVGLLNSLLKSRKFSFEESSASVKKRTETKKQKVIDVIRFLKIKNLKSAGISLDSLISARFNLPEILKYGGYSPSELNFYGITEAQIKRAQEYNVKNVSKFDKNFKDFMW